jgi:gluconokinase
MTHDASVGPSAAVEPLILALDIGTSSARALVYDARARMVHGLESHHPYPVTTTPDGGVVTDADTLVQLTAQCIDDILGPLKASSCIPAAVSTDTFWHSLLGVDERGRAITPVYTWADTRSSSAVPELRRRLDAGGGHGAPVHARTGAELHSSYWPAKLLWLGQTQPDLMDRVSYWMSFGEYLYLQLFGERLVSISMASGTGLFDQNACTWDRELLEVLPLRVEQLSPLCEFSDGMKGLRAPFDTRWRSLADVPWFLALGDGACNNVGSGGFCDQWAVLMVGTSGALRVVREAERADTPPGLWTYRVDRRRFVQGGALSDGGNVFAWLEHVLQLDPVEQLEEELAAMPPDGHGLTVLPFLAGERSPHWNLDARAAMVGMTLHTKAIDVVRAWLEAVAYSFGIVFDILKQSINPTGGIIGSGAGLIHSPAWLQMMSDVLDEPLVVSAVPEGTSRGAALLALEAMGALPDLGAAPAPLGKQYEPDGERTGVYEAARRRQEKLYSLLIESGGEPWPRR